MAKIGSSIKKARKPAITDIKILCFLLRFISRPPLFEIIYTCKNFRMANREPPTPMKAPTAQNTARMVGAMEL